MNDREVPVEITVYTFRIGDYEDPDLAAGAQLWEWEHSDQGQWVVTRSISIPTWYRRMDPSGWGWRYEIRALMPARVATEYFLRWG